MSKLLEDFLNNSIETIANLISRKLLKGRLSQKKLNKIINVLTVFIVILTIMIALLVSYAMYTISKVDWDTAMANSPIIYAAVTIVALIGVVLFKVQTTVKKRLDELKKKSKAATKKKSASRKIGRTSRKAK